MTSKLRSWQTALAALLLVLVLTFSFVPQARAALLSIFSFNGVDVSVDDATNELVVSGNTDAVVYQDENNVLIESEDGSMLAGINREFMHIETVAVSDLAAQYPDFVLPTNVPDGYTLETDAGVSSGMVTVSWQHASGESITYMWNVPAMPDFDLPGEIFVSDGEIPEALLEGLPEGSVFVESDGVILEELPEGGAIIVDSNGEVLEELPADFHQGPFQTFPDGHGGQHSVLQIENDGTPVQIIATDETISEAL